MNSSDVTKAVFTDMFWHKKALTAKHNRLFFVIYSYFLATYGFEYYQVFFLFFYIFVCINLFVTFDLLLPRGTRVGVS